MLINIQIYETPKKKFTALLNSPKKHPFRIQNKIPLRKNPPLRYADFAYFPRTRQFDLIDNLFAPPSLDDPVNILRGNSRQIHMNYLAYRSSNREPKKSSMNYKQSAI